MDAEHREAFMAASRPGWRAWAPYLDVILDGALDARTARDVADLEALYRTQPAPAPVFAEARPFDHGADWLTP